MVALRSRRLESLLGARVDQISRAHLQALVDNGVAEDYDLDLKSSLYWRSDSEKRDLAGDVAALANTAGGVLIIGVQENSQARADALVPVELSDAETARMLQVIASNTAPMPQLDILRVNDPVASAALDRPVGYYLIAVPRSPRAPHAVLINDALRYPRRNGPTIRHLSEAEVADAYRDRLAGFASNANRLRQLDKEAVDRLDRGSRPWLVVTLVPDTPGRVEVGRASFIAFQTATVGRPAYTVGGDYYGRHFQQAGVGAGRFLADGSIGPGLSSGVSAELYRDGAGTYAIELVDYWTRDRAGEAVLRTGQLIDDETLILAAISGLQSLARHARDRAACGGGIAIRARIVSALEAGYMQLGTNRAGYTEPLTERQVAATTAPASESSAMLDDLVAAGPELIAVTARLVNGIFQAFGVPEAYQVTSDGEIRQPYWSRSLFQYVRRWADSAGVPIIGAVD